MHRWLIKVNQFQPSTFDGTVRKAKRATSRGFTLMPHCAEILEKLHDDGFRMILWTCRSPDMLEDVIIFLKKHDILQYFECINENVKDESWDKTAMRIKNKYPEISKYLNIAYKNFSNKGNLT